MTDQQQHREHAARELERRLRPWVEGMADLPGFCDRYLEWLADQRWMRVHEPRPIAGGKPTAQQTETNDRGIALARELLAQAREDLHGDHLA